MPTKKKKSYSRIPDKYKKEFEKTLKGHSPYASSTPYIRDDVYHETSSNFADRISSWNTTKNKTKYSDDMAEREELAQKEIQRKQNQVGQLYNKGGYGYMPNPEDWKEAGKKNATGIGER